MSKTTDNGVKVETTGERMTALLAGATAADMAEIDQQIAGVNARYDELLAAQKSELSSLKALRKLIDLRLNGPKQRKAPKPRQPGGAPGGAMIKARRNAIARLLAREGAMPTMSIASRCDIPEGSIGAVLKCDWFLASSAGYRLTDKGRQESGV